MRTATVSALCVLLSLICSASPTAGQSNPPTTSWPPSQVMPAPTKFPELQRVTETKGAPLGTNSIDEPGNPLQSWVNLLAQQDKPKAEQFQAVPKERIKEEILSQLESNRCAHILIFQAPKSDSAMIVEAPPGAGGNITTFKGLRPCCSDLRGLRGLPPIGPRTPLVQPPVVLPKKNAKPAPDLGDWLNHLRP
jgi:hypothetical protein